MNTTTETTIQDLKKSYAIKVRSTQYRNYVEMHAKLEMGDGFEIDTIVVELDCSNHTRVTMAFYDELYESNWKKVLKRLRDFEGEDITEGQARIITSQLAHRLVRFNNALIDAVDHNCDKDYLPF